MNERQRQQLLDEREDDLLQALFDDAMEREDEAWLNAGGTAGKEELPEIPKELDAQCRELIHAAERKHKRIQFLKCAGIGIKRAAIVALVVVCFVSTLALSVDAFRLPILNVLVGKDNRYSTIYFSMKPLKGEELRLAEKIQSIPRPDGYAMTKQWSQDDGTFGFVFQNKELKTLQVSYIASVNLVNYDTEDSEQIQMKVLESDALFIKKQGLRVIWVDDASNGVFDVRADGLSEKEFWKYVIGIAESSI